MRIGTSTTRRFHLRITRGLTLIESMSALAIAGILIGSAVPAFESQKSRRVLDGVAAEIAVELQLARREAVSRQQGVRWTVKSHAGGNCVVVHTGDAADCTCTVDGPAQCTGAAQMIKSTYYPAGHGISVSANVGSLRFEPVHGMTTPAGTVTIATPRGVAIAHVVNIMGRVRSCSPTANVTGLKPC